MTSIIVLCCSILIFVFYFWDYNIITTFAPFLSSQQTFSHTCLWYLSTIYIYIYIYNTYIYNPKYNLFSLYNVICMYGFWADILALDNQLVCSSLGKTTMPNVSFPQLSIFLWTMLRPLGFSLSTLLCHWSSKTPLFLSEWCLIL